MLCGPGIRVVVSVAVPVLGLTGSLANSTPLSVNSTLLLSTASGPPLPWALTEAVKVTCSPAFRLVAEAVRMVDVLIGWDGEVTVTAITEDVLGLKSLLPR